jgi:ABC-type multidrug transport system permease subunit
MKFIKNLARRHKVIVVASIHQPSTTIFELFDQLLLLSAGKTCYFGPVDNVQSYFAGINQPIPLHINPAEFMLDLVNTDFVKKDENTSLAQLQGIHEAWGISQEFQHLTAKLNRELSPSSEKMASKFVEPLSGRTKLLLPITLLHRNFIKSYRDVIPYGVRLAMYMGLAILVGTVWLRLSYHQSSIQPFISALFFGSAFMSFMAVAYVPAVIEDLHTLHKERANGLYGPLPFVIANFLIGIPYLFLISLFFSVVPYWLSNFRPTAYAFSTWVMWLFLDLLAAEGLVVLVTSVAPVFVVALAVTAFANGLWMSVSGFMVPVGTLNVFWKYVFHYIDYQAYVFQGMMVNQFGETVWDCDVVSSTRTSSQPQYNCMYPSDLQSQGQIRGTAVLQTYGYETGKTGKWVGIMLGIIVAYRVLGYFALKLSKN